MATFNMMIGPAGCGKSTCAEKLWNYNLDMEIISSDAIREELYGDASTQGDPKEVFATMQWRAMELIEEGISVIYDATNLTYNNRKAILDKVKSKAYCNAFIVATPIETIFHQNENRNRVVPKEVIINQLKHFEMPTYEEGFDSIIIIDDAGTVPVFNEFVKMIDFNQDNQYHSLTLDRHCIAAYVNIKTDEFWLKQAALLHDYGKLYTKTFYTLKGEKTEDAHYYNHQNIGSYLSLSMDMLHNRDDQIKTAIAICYHMQPFFSKTEKSINKWKARLGEEMWNSILLLHKADVEAH